MVKTEGLRKGEVLAALYNASKVQGMGYLQARPGRMTEKEADDLLKNDTYFDYLYGKIMKVNLVLDSGFDERWYDRDNGDGAAQRAIDNIGS